MQFLTLNSNPSKPMLRVALYGFSISVMGALPLGTLNVTALQLSTQSGFWVAMEFAVAVAAVEVIYAYLCTLASASLDITSDKGRLLTKVVMVIFAAMAIYYFFVAYTAMPGTNRTTQPVSMQPFLYGLLLSSLNPFQFPFWISWSLQLQQKKILQTTIASRVAYVTGIGIGTIAVLLCFIVLGHSFASALRQYQAGIFVALALLFLWGSYRSYRQLVR
jgi:threonine/homoserine/homoserine lactone efflux protein